MITFHSYFSVLYSTDNLPRYKYHRALLMEELKPELSFTGSHFVDYSIFIGGNIDIETKIQIFGGKALDTVALKGSSSSTCNKKCKKKMLNWQNNPYGKIMKMLT